MADLVKAAMLYSTLIITLNAFVVFLALIIDDILSIISQAFV